MPAESGSHPPIPGAGKTPDRGLSIRRSIHDPSPTPPGANGAKPRKSLREEPGQRGLNPWIQSLLNRDFRGRILAAAAPEDDRTVRGLAPVDASPIDGQADAEDRIERIRR
jgi:hypothetical protein